MTDEQLVAALSSLVGVVLLLVLVRLFSAFFVDSLRERLFTLRDELFVYAHNNGLMDDPSHRFLRDLINGMIRYAHRHSLSRTFLLWISQHFLSIQPKMPEAFVRWAEAANALPKEQCDAMTTFHARAIALMVVHMLKTSPIGIVLIMIGALVIGLRRLSKGALATLSWRNQIQIELVEHAPRDLIEVESMRAIAA